MKDVHETVADNIYEQVNQTAGQLPEGTKKSRRSQHIVEENTVRMRATCKMKGNDIFKAIGLDFEVKRNCTKSIFKLLRRFVGIRENINL